MVTGQQIDEKIASLEKVVESGLDYFGGEGATSEARIDLWTPRDVLCHMLYWHQATVEGMESVASGGEPHKIYASTDEMNARAVGRAAGKNVPQLVDEVKELQARLSASARKLEDPNAVVLIRGNGDELSAVQRLEGIASHWNGHLKELGAI